MKTPSRVTVEARPLVSKMISTISNAKGLLLKFNLIWFVDNDGSLRVKLYGWLMREFQSLYVVV